MKNVQDLFNDVANSIKNRFSNPLVTAFLFSWMTWNYKFLLVIFLDGGPWPERLYYIDNFIHNGYNGVLLGFIFPLTTALIWIYILPPIFTRVSVWHVRQNNLNNNLINEASGEKILTQEDNINLRISINKQWKELENLTNENSFAIERHVKQINDLVKEREQILADSLKLTSDISERDGIISHKNDLIITKEKRIERLKAVANEKREAFLFESSVDKTDEEMYDLLKSIFTAKTLISQFNLIHSIRNKYKSRMFFPLIVRKRTFYNGEFLLDRGDVITVDFLLALYLVFEVYGFTDNLSLQWSEFVELMKKNGFNENIIINYFSYHKICQVSIINNKVSYFVMTDLAHNFFSFFQEIGFHKEISTSLNSEVVN